MKPRLAQRAEGRMENQKHKQENDIDEDRLFRWVGYIKIIIIAFIGKSYSSLYIYSPPKRRKIIPYKISVANIEFMATKLQK